MHNSGGNKPEEHEGTKGGKLRVRPDFISTRDFSIAVEKDGSVRLHCLSDVGTEFMDHATKQVNLELQSTRGLSTHGGRQWMEAVTT